MANKDASTAIVRRGTLGVFKRGFGTVSPGQTIHVRSASNQIRLQDSSNDYKYDLDVDASKFSIADMNVGVNRLTIDSAGKVGINQTSPDSLLHIEDDNTLTKHLLHIKGGGASGAYGVLVEAANGTDLFKIDTSSYKVTMPSGYPVGIGTNAPAYKLEVKASVTGDWLSRIYNTATTSNPSGLLVRIDDADSTGTILGVNNAGSYHMVVKGDGKVGIGTNAPTSELHLYTTSGNNYLKIENQSTSQAALWWKTGTTDASWIAYIPSSSSDLRLYAGADKVTFKTDGKVGIGTTAPEAKLHIKGSEGLVLQSDSGGGDERWMFDANGYQGYLGIGFSATSTPGTPKLVVKEDGKVGIGTTSPTSKLCVGGVSTQTTNLPTVAVVDMTAGAKLQLRGQAPTIFMDSTSSGIPKILMDGRGIEFKDGTLDSEGNVDVKIAADGKVGIGTTSPDHKLQIKGDISIDNESSSVPSMLHFNASNKSNLDPTSRICFWEADGHAGTYTDSHAFIEYNGSTAAGGDGYLALGGYTDAGANQDIMVLNRLGKVGIGTTAPDSKLEIAGGGYNSSLKIKSDGADSGIQFEDSAGNTDGYIYANGDSIGFLDSGTNYTIQCKNDDYIKFSTNGDTEHMRIKSDGNVGIGTTAPAALLHVSAGYVNTRKSLILTNSTNTPFTGTTYDSVVINQDDVPTFRMRETGNAGNVELTFAVGNEYSNSATIGTTGMFKFATNRDVGQTGYLDQNTRMVILADGNVGIGATAPAGPLHVINNHAGERNVFFDNPNASGAMQLQVRAGSSNEYLSLYRNSTFAGIYVASDPFYIKHYHSSAWHDSIAVATDGKVGINTSSPVEQLHVNGGQIRVNHGTSGVTMGEYSSGAVIWLDGANGDFSGGDYFNIRANNSAQLTLGYAGGESVILTSNGKLGIGVVPNSANRLQVNGQARATTAMFGNSSVSNVAAKPVHIKYGGPASLRLEDSEGSNLVYDLTSDYGTGFIIRDETAGTNRLTIAASTGDATFSNDVIITGGLTVNGATTTVDTTNLLIEDPLMLLARVQSGTPTLDSGFIIERGSSTNVGLIWDESTDRFAFIGTTDTATTAGNVSILNYSHLTANSLRLSTEIANVDQTALEIGSDVHGSNTKDAWIKIYNSNSTNDRTWSLGGQSGRFQLRYLGARATSPSGGQEALTVSGSGNLVSGGAINDIFTGFHSALSTAIGDVLFYKSEAEYSVTDDNSNSNYHTIKSFRPEKSGAFRIKFSAYIQSGSYYWAYRIYNETTSTSLYTGYFASTAGSGNGLDDGQSSSVHNYRRFRIDIAAGKVRAGDNLQIQMVSSSGSGSPVAGNGQKLYMKEFRAYSSSQSSGIQHYNGDIRIGTSSLHTGHKGKLWVQGDRTYLTSSGNGHSTIRKEESALVLGPSTGRTGTAGHYVAGIAFDHLLNWGTEGQVGYHNAGPHCWIGMSIKDTPNYERSSLVFATRTGTGSSDLCTEKMRIQPDGNVGIGTTAPSAPLEVVGADSGITISSAANNRPHLRLVNGTTNMLQLSANGTYGAIGDGTNANRYMSFKAGSVGVNRVDPSYQLDVNGTFRTTGVATFNTGATISNNQPLNIGTTGSNTGYVRLYNNNSTAYYLDWQSTGARAYRYHGSGSSSAFTTTFSQAGSGGHNLVVNGTITESSSIALKENVFDFTSPLEKISKIRPVKYNKKESKKKEIGLIAEELAEIFPELVENDENGNPTSVNYTRAVTVLFDGFKQMYKELKEIKEKIK